MNKPLRGIIHVYCRINGFFLALDAGGVVIWLGSAREDLVRGTVAPSDKISSRC